MIVYARCTYLHAMERQTAADFNEELPDLYDEYVHGKLNRRTFLVRANKFDIMVMDFPQHRFFSNRWKILTASAQ